MTRRWQTGRVEAFSDGMIAGIAFFPKAAAFAYLVIAALAVFRAHGEGRLLISGTG